MMFRQILHPATGCASYIFGCTGKRALAVVDPHSEHIADYLEVSESARRLRACQQIGVGLAIPPEEDEHAPPPPRQAMAG